jgi:hypothetical protein
MVASFMARHGDERGTHVVTDVIAIAQTTVQMIIAKDTIILSSCHAGYWYKKSKTP